MTYSDLKQENLLVTSMPTLFSSVVLLLQAPYYMIYFELYVVLPGKYWTAYWELWKPDLGRGGSEANFVWMCVFPCERVHV